MNKLKRKYESLDRQVNILSKQRDKLKQRIVKSTESKWDDKQCFILAIVKKNKKKAWIPVWRKDDFIILKPEVKGMFLWYDMEFDYISPSHVLRWYRGRFYRYREEEDGTLDLSLVDSSLITTDQIITVRCDFKCESGHDIK